MAEANKSQKHNQNSLAREIWRDRKSYIYYAQARFNITRDDAEDLFVRAGFKIVENPEKIDRSKNLTNYVKKRINWIFHDDIEKKERDEAALERSVYNLSDKDEQFFDFKPFEIKKPLHLKENSIRTENNDKNKIFISTKNPHKANLGSAVILTGFNDNELSERTKDRLRNKWGNEIVIDEIIDEHTFSIRVWFDHEISEIGIGGKNVRVGIKSKPSVLKNENLSKVLSENTEEDITILKMRIDDCKKQFTEREKAILDLSLHPDQDITNQQRPTTEKIAEILGMAAGTVGDLAIQIREAFMNCIEGKTRVNV